MLFMLFFLRKICDILMSSNMGGLETGSKLSNFQAIYLFNGSNLIIFLKENLLYVLEKKLNSIETSSKIPLAASFSVLNSVETHWTKWK